MEGAHEIPISVWPITIPRRVHATCPPPDSRSVRRNDVEDSEEIPGDEDRAPPGQVDEGGDTAGIRRKLQLLAEHVAVAHVGELSQTVHQHDPEEHAQPQRDRVTGDEVEVLEGQDERERRRHDEVGEQCGLDLKPRPFRPQAGLSPCSREIGVVLSVVE
jgi:hypothetical protein